MLFLLSVFSCRFPAWDNSHKPQGISSDLKRHNVDIVVQNHEKKPLPRITNLVWVLCDLPDISSAKVHNDRLKRNPAIRLEKIVLL